MPRNYPTPINRGRFGAPSCATSAGSAQHPSHVLPVVASDQVSFTYLYQGRVLRLADLRREGAPGMKSAARRRLPRARHLASQDEPLLQLASPEEMGRPQQSSGVGVLGLEEDLLEGPRLDYLPRVHYGDPVAHVPDHGEVVGNEKVGDSEFSLDAVEEVEDLSLNRGIEGGCRFVENHEARPYRKRPGDRDPLRLPATQLVGILLGERG